MLHVGHALLATVAVIGFASVASAADMPVKAQPVVDPIATWTGFYVGVDAGYAWGTARNSVLPLGLFATALSVPSFFAANGSSTQDLNGFTGGAQAGANYQMGALVLGFEVDANFMQLKESRSITALHQNTFSYRFDTSNKINALYTVRPRVGYAFGNTLVYTTGGLAIADRSFSYSQTCVTQPGCRGLNVDAVNVDKYAVGWTIGGGLEHAFGRNWTIKVEYLYADLGSFEASSVNTYIPAYFIKSSSELTVQTVRAGINYKF